MELNGTFFLVLTIGMSVINGGSGVIPLLAIISVLMAMIFAGGRPLQSRRDSGNLDEWPHRRQRRNSRSQMTTPSLTSSAQLQHMEANPHAILSVL
jgi:hypothetical protein